MSVRMRMARSKTGSRRSHHALEGPRLSKDSESEQPRLRHRAHPETGRYRGRVVVDMTAKLQKQEKKRKEREREAMMQGQGGNVQKQKEADEKEPAQPPRQEPLDASKLSQREQ